ncbi:MAG: XRE family transcriptional regulator [Deltaproteobacteria bacterium]|nr:XRE family transcriptional regulator [Deltaproteobacteria bacterium]
MNTDEREILKEELKDKEYRDIFVSVTVDQTIPFQIRTMRLSKDRHWTQEELAKRSGMMQPRIAACENPNYGKFSLQTLKRIAAAFDVALIVRFAPFSELVEWKANLSPDSFNVRNFENEEHYFYRITETETTGSLSLREEYSGPQVDQSLKYNELPKSASNILTLSSEGNQAIPEMPIERKRVAR